MVIVGERQVQREKSEDPEKKNQGKSKGAGKRVGGQEIGLQGN